jgi:hypothetical protein
VRTFTEAGHFDDFSLHAGDTEGTLKGSRLDEVASLSIKNVLFTPGELSSKQGSDELPMIASDAQAAAALKPERIIAAKILLKDGRVLPLTAAVDAPRPRVALLSKSVELAASARPTNVELADPNELPQGATLVFSIRAQSPAAFAHDESIEVATADESSDTRLSLAGGGLALENSEVAVATLNPSKAFGAAAFGPLKFRVTTKGTAGDWQPLATLVRLPQLEGLKCPATSDLACKLTGADLYLIDSVSGDAQFKDPVQVPEGFLGSALPVPHPSAGTMYIKLRDNPQIVNPTTLGAEPLPTATGDSDRTEVRQSALRTDATPASP